MKTRSPQTREKQEM